VDSGILKRKMADCRQLSICEPLCFAISRYRKLGEKQLKRVLIEFFTKDQLFVAKNRLCEDIAKLQLELWPQPIQHTDTDKQASLDVDDIYMLITFLDGELLLDKLPIYVCENIDQIPSVHWLDSDIQIIIGRLNTMLGPNSYLFARIDHLKTVAETQFQQINMQRQQINDLKIQNDLQKEAFDKQLAHFEINMKKELEKSSNGCADRCISEIMCKLAHTQDIHFPPLGHTSGVEAASLAAQSVNNNIVSDENRMHCETPTQPSETIQPVVQPPFSQQPPVVHRQQNQQNQSGASAWNENDGGEFQNYHSRQYRRRQAKRLRVGEKPPNERQTRLKVVGKANNNTGLRAFSDIVDKRVFSVSNVDSCYTVDDVQTFLQNVGIRAITVHDAKSKFDGKCFRVCIATADTDRLLVPDIWPENVIIRPWYFKEKNMKTLNINDVLRTLSLAVD